MPYEKDPDRRCICRRCRCGHRRRHLHIPPEGGALTMAFCSHCGAPLAEGDAFCSHCGAPARAPGASGQPARPQGAPVAGRQRGSLCCALAYLGTLFWLPLVACPGDPAARRCANQGLWALLLAVLACTGIRMLGMLNSWLSGGLAGVLAGAAYSLVFLAFLLFMFYLAAGCLHNALAVRRGELPAEILFFDRIRLLSEL